MSEKTKPPSERRVLMAHDVVRRFIFEQANPEFRFRVYTASDRITKFQLHNLRKFRDGTGRELFANLDPISDLGMQSFGDSFSVWSRNRRGLIQLKDYFEKHGFETSGVW